MKMYTYLAVGLFMLAGVHVGWSQNNRNKKTDDPSVETRYFDKFNRVEVRNRIEVEMVKGSRNAIDIEVIKKGGTTATASLSSYLVTRINGGKLILSLSKKFLSNTTFKARLTYTEQPYALYASSSASVFSATPLTESTLQLEAKSSSSIDVSVKTKKLYVVVASAAKVVLTGKADLLNVSAGSAGKVEAYRLSSKQASVKANSAAKVKLTVTDKLEARSSSGAQTLYRGDPKNKNIRSVSGGSVQKSD